VRLAKVSRATAPMEGKALAAKSHGDDVRKIVLATQQRQLGRGMTFDRQLEIIGRHAAAVILHQQQIGTAMGGSDVDAGGARIHRILHQFLDRGGRPLDDFTGGDTVDRTL